MILSLFDISGLAMETIQKSDLITNVSTSAELRAALENNQGGNIRLIKDINFTTQNARDRDFGVILGQGYYKIDLNGYKIEYNYIGSIGDPYGTPLATVQTKGLTINGPGNIVGGTYGIEQMDQFGSLTVNGGNINGVIGSGIRMTGGITYINGGNISGNFYGIFHEDGIVILNGGMVKSVVKRSMGGHEAKKHGVIEKGIFKGNAIIEDIVLYVDDLTISPLSSIKIIRGGGLVVKNNFVNNGSFIYESGLKSIAGKGEISKEYRVTISRDMTFNFLNIREKASLYLENDARVKVIGEFSTEENCGVLAENGRLELLGKIDHKGSAVGVPELNPHRLNFKKRDFINEIQAAERLKALGLFQGVATNKDGSTDFELDRSPSRAEALVMLIRLLGKEEQVVSKKWTHPFDDVPAWADQYVGYAYENKLAKGISPREFGKDNASYQMYLTFVLRSLGYSDSGGVDFTWDKPEDLALSIGITLKGVDRYRFLRADVVTISEEALSAKIKNSQETLLDRLRVE